MFMAWIRIFFPELIQDPDPDLGPASWIRILDPHPGSGSWTRILDPDQN